MLKIVRRCEQCATDEQACGLTLGFEERRKSRQKVRLDDGREAALHLPRGTVLRQGDVLEAEGGERVVVRAEAERLSYVLCPDPAALARLCYHLGNRHHPVQIEGERVFYPAGPVIDAMVAELGHAVAAVSAAFEPECGAHRH
ncbi:MAG: urease accessory protein UreE [Desulfovibrionaceae bacterium]|nr:urease accessory protein UreE [Desulfovibrionaceae bacterium]MBF0513398.1 urease accessory protein UreE [Desulfovibrionaceae bacterium]